MRKNFMKRTLVFILVLAMVLGGSGSSVLADEIDGTGQDPVTIEETDEPSEDTVMDPEGSSEDVVTDAGGKTSEEGDDFAESSETKPDTVSGDIVEADDEYPDGLLEMPEDYVMSEEQEQIKENTIKHDVVGDLEGLAPDKDYVDEEVICLAGALEEAEAIAAAYGGVLNRFTYGVANISLKKSPLTVEEAVKAGADPDTDVPAVSPNYITEQEKPVVDEETASSLMSAPSAKAPSPKTWDDIYGSLPEKDPYLNPTDPQYQWMHDMVDTYAAWGVTSGNDSVTVAVLDTGVRDDHTEFHYPENRIAGIIDLDMSKGAYDPRSDQGYRQHFHDEELKDQLPEGVTWKDDYAVCGHGTHVAGIIAAAAGNGKGGSGIAPNVKILSVPLVLMDKGGGMPDEGIIAALNAVSGYDKDTGELTGRKADIINMSLGGHGYSALYDAAIQHAYEAGVTVVAAMSNNNANDLAYPAGYDHVIAVASVNENGYRSGFSTYGPWADVAAPGSHIYSTSHNGTDAYEDMSGTSMATPVVTGVCALYMSAFGHVDPDTMESVIRSSVTASPSSQIGTGIVNAAKLFGSDIGAPKIEITDNETLFGVAEDGQTVTLSYDIAKNAMIEITPPTRTSGSNGMIVYTADGRTPTIRNGEVVIGTKYVDDPEHPLTVGDIADGVTAKKKITVKSAVINNLGLIGKVTTIVFTYDPSLDTSDAGKHASTVVISDAPVSLIAGTSTTLKGAVTEPESQTGQSVSWEIAGFTPTAGAGNSGIGASIDAKGLLKTSAGMDGVLKVRCISEDGKAADEAEIRIKKNTNPVKNIILNSTNETLCISKYDDENMKNKKDELRVRVTSITDKNNVSFLDAGNKVTGVALSWTSSNPKVAVVKNVADDNDGDVLIKAAGKGTAVITCTALDGGKAKKTLKVTVTQDVEEISVTGQRYVRKDNNAKYKYKAIVLPASANDRSVTWGVTTYYYEGEDIKFDNGPLDNSKIDITSAGVLTVPEDATVHDDKNYCVYAASNDGGDVYGMIPIDIITEPKITSVYILGDGDLEAPFAPSKKTKSLKNMDVEYLSSAYIFNADIEGVEKTENKIALGVIQSVTGDDRKEYVPVDGGGNPVLIAPSMSWTSSNTKVATVKGNDDGTAVVTAVAGAKGKTTITCTATDGSGKKASVTINVVQPVTGINVSGTSFIVAGNKAAFKAAVTPASANYKSLKWTVAGDEAAGEKPKVRINETTGTVEVDADATSGKEYTVTAKAGDGSGIVSDGYKFKVVKDKTTSVVIKRSDTQAKETGYEVVNKIKFADRTLKNTDPAVKIEDTFSSITLFNVNTEGHTWDETKYVVKGCLIGTKKNASNKNEEFIITETNKPEWTTSNANIVTLTQDAEGNVTMQAVADAKGTATVTCAASDGSGKKATLKVNVVQPVSGMVVSGPSVIAKGCKGTFTATVSPKEANLKTVNWKVEKIDGEGHWTPVNSNDKITVSSKGVVTVGSGAVASVNPYRVVVTSDDGGYHVEKTFMVLANKASKVSVYDVYDDSDIPVEERAEYKDKYEKAHAIVEDEENSIESLRLYTENIDKYKDPDYIDETGIVLEGEPDNVSGVLWITSNKDVVSLTYDIANPDKVTLKAGKPGKATLTCTANDGSGVKTKINVTVIIPVSSMKLAVKGSNDDMIAMGKSVQLQPSFGNAYGKPTITDVEWSWKISRPGDEGWIDDFPSDSETGNYASIDKKGKLSIPKRMPEGTADPGGNIIFDNAYPCKYYVMATATAADGTGRSASCGFTVYAATYGLELDTPDPIPLNKSYEKPVKCLYYYWDKDEEAVETSADQHDVNVVSSNPKVATAYYEYQTGNLVIMAYKKGTANITITTIDGSNIRKSFKCKVVDP